MADNEARDPMVCPNCKVTLQYIDTKDFHEGGGSPKSHFFFGGWAELSEGRITFDIYYCPRCGRVELFLDGVGENFRPH